MRTIAAHRKDVHGLAFAPDGRTIASVGGQSAAAWLWDARTGELVRRLPGRRDRGRAVAFGPDGQSVAAADNRNLVRVWKLPGGEPAAEIPVTRYMPAYDLAFLPDGSAVATASEQVRVWPLGGFDPPYREAPTHALARDHGRWFFSVCPSADGSVLAFGSRTAVCGWWPATGVVRVLAEVSAQVHSLAFAPAGDALAAAFGFAVRVIEVPTGRARATLTGHQGMVWKVAYTPDGARLVTASSDGSVRFWDAATGAARGSYDWRAGKVRCVAVSPDGLTVASGGQDGRIVIADIDP